MNAKRISKRLIAVVLTMMLVISCFAVSFTANAVTDGNIEFIVNYHREDGDYSKSDVYLWDGLGSSYEVPFDSEGVASVEISAAALEIGFIIRQVAGDWGTKDPDGDRKVDTKSFIGGTIQVFCESGSKLNDFRTDTTDAIEGLKILSASASDDYQTVTFTMPFEPDEADISDIQEYMTVNYGLPTSTARYGSAVSDQGPIVPIDSIEISGTTGTITLAEPLNKFSTFRVNYGYASTAVKMPDYFSTQEFEDLYTYDGDDLGATYAKSGTTFRVWSPAAVGMSVNIYEAGDGDNLIDSYQMDSDAKGTWVATLDEDLNGKYYTYTARFAGDIVDEDIVDPYAKSVGVNGERGMILDLDSTDPEGWSGDSRQTKASATDLVIYEVSVRDFSSDPDSGITNAGKYLAFTENGTVTPKGVATGIDHLKDLGITSVHLLPTYDFGWSEETTNAYNWGYDPVNYNSPEGSYSTDPYHGEIRVNEYKQMVKALHDAGIGVIMDAVYNHTYSTDFCYNRLVPGFFYRPGQNTSGCGNDVATERNMVRKFITDSVKYWIDEYHLDGVRFDLMGILDVDTMNQIRSDANAIDSNIFLYGEGWDMGSISTKSGVQMANYKNASLMPGIAFFSDTIRDGIKGSVFENETPGYVNGKKVAAAGKVVDGVTYTKSWSPSPSQIINYQSCHDNLTVWDKLLASTPDNTDEDRIKMNKLGAAIVFTAQGVPFMMSGEEFLRTKDGNKDSVRAGDAINMLDYSRISQFGDVNEYYKGLIAMRKAFPQLRMATADEVDSSVEMLTEGTKAEGHIISYMIRSVNGNMLVYYNPADDAEVELPEGFWGVVANGDKAGADIIETISGKVTIPGITALVLVSADKKDEGGNNSGDNGNNGGGNTDNGNTDNGNNGNGTNTDNNNTNTNTGANDNNNNNVNNGDTSAPATADYSMAFVFVAIAAAAGFVAIVAYRKRKFVK